MLPLSLQRPGHSLKVGLRCFLGCMEGEPTELFVAKKKKKKKNVERTHSDTSHTMIVQTTENLGFSLSLFLFHCFMVEVGYDLSVL